MTGFAARDGGDATRRWRWEARSVNARGLDLRLRLPEGLDALEGELRRHAQATLRRGAVTVTLRVEGAEAAGPALDPAALAAAAAALVAARAAAEAAGLAVGPVAPERLLALRGVMREGPRADPPPVELLAADIGPLLEALVAARAAEGAETAAALTTILDAIAALVETAARLHVAQTSAAPDRLREKVAALLGAGAEVAPERLAAELALLAVKADVGEEIDRLRAHLSAARRMLAEGGALGRELDFLTQEFNREANTLCSKSGSLPLTEAGLALKVQIDRLREQAQNIE